MLRSISTRLHPASRLSRCLFSTSSTWNLKQMPPRPPPLDEADITEAFLKGSGPGGQKINKTNSAVQLKHLPTGIVVKVQETRSRSQNRKLAREMLALRVEALEKGEGSRTAIVGEVKKRKKSSASKKTRRKYRALEGEKEGEEGEEGVVGEEVLEGETVETVEESKGGEREGKTG